jgi:hypothetical protein
VCLMNPKNLKQKVAGEKGHNCDDKDDEDGGPSNI